MTKRSGKKFLDRGTDMPILIDFAPGAYGHFVEYACNTIIAGIATAQLPFSSSGNSHNIIYTESPKFLSAHYSFEEFKEPVNFTNAKVVQIKHGIDDLLTLLAGMYERTGFDLNINELHINTFNKLSVGPSSRQLLLQHLQTYYFDNSKLIQSYESIKDPTWPAVSNVKQYNKLPTHIQDELKNIHGFKLFEFTASSPNCPRHILRDYYRRRFEFPEEYLKLETKFQYEPSTNVYTIPFADVLKKDQFETHLRNISRWANSTVEFNYTEFSKLYDKFIQKQPYCNLREHCDDLINRLKHQEIFEFEQLHLLEESRILAELGIDNYENDLWFSNSAEIYEKLAKNQLTAK